jgi:hypothetical protein
MSKRTYTLPDGKPTISERRFKREWKRMQDVIERVFGGRVIAHGPGALIAKEGSESFDLPQWALNGLLEYCEYADSE